MSSSAASDSVAEPWPRVETWEDLVYLLGQACEIEHGLMCEYLYAQFSLKRDPDEGLTPGQLARVQAWEAALINVIKQEMLHLALSTNILTSVGAARHARPLPVDDRPLVAVPQEWRTVGHLYRAIEAGLTYLCDRDGEAAVFIGPPSAQAVTGIFEGPELMAVTDLASARQDAAWRVIKERLHGLGQTCDSLAKEPGAAALAQLARRLRAIADEVSHRLATRVEQPCCTSC